MSNVVPFPTRLRPTQPITAEQVEVRDALIVTMGTRCSACADRGVVFFQSVFGPSFRPCPCGGSGSDRVDLNEVIGRNDFGGAA